MAECAILPTISETNLNSAASAVSPTLVMSEVSTVSSTVPMKYERRVRFAQFSLSSDSLASNVSDHSPLDSTTEEILPDVRQRSRPLAHIEPLTVSSLHQTQGSLQDVSALGKDGQAASVRPRIEIRLCRPRSLNNVSDDTRAPVLDLLNKDPQEADANCPSPRTRSRNRWLLAKKKLTRFASSPSLFSYNDNKKADTTDDDSLRRPQTLSESSSNLEETDPDLRKIGTDILRRFKKKKPKVLTPPRARSSKPLYVEVFKKTGEEEPCRQNMNLQNFEVIDLDVLKPDGTRRRMSKAETHADDSLDTSMEEGRPDNDDPPSSSRPSNADTASPDHGVNAHLMLHLTTQVPSANGVSKPHLIVKDATNVQPFKDGEVLITDILSNKMVLFDTHGLPKVSFTLDNASEPWAACLTPDGTLAVTLKYQGCVSLWSMSGIPISEFGSEVLSAPTGIQVDSLNRFVVADEKLNSVTIFSRHGQFILNFIQPQIYPPSSLSSPAVSEMFRFNKPRYVCVTDNGYYVISDSANHCVRIFDGDGNYSHQIGSFGSKDGHFRFPYGVACDGIGQIYVADYFNHRVSVFSFEGGFQFHTLTSKDGIIRPKGLAIHDHRLYVTYGNLRAGKIGVFNLSNRQLTLATRRLSVTPGVG